MPSDLEDVPRGFLGTVAKNPFGPETRQVLIPVSLADRFQRYGPAHKFYELRSVQEVLGAPAVVFEGLKRHDQADGLCFAGCPTRRYTNEGTGLPFPPGKTFTVYLTAGFKVFDWSIEPADKSKAEWPEDWEDRYDRAIWSLR